jgi:hypothetical protein
MQTFVSSRHCNRFVQSLNPVYLDFLIECDLSGTPGAPLARHSQQKAQEAAAGDKPNI